jgi:rubrerythrin
MYSIEDKNFYRCSVCNDIHFGEEPPQKCPTCRAENAYVKIDSSEAKRIERFE